MEKENVNYYIQFVRNQQNSSFGGSALNCDEYIEETIHDAVAMMDKYSAQGNRWWLRHDEKMAYFQLKEISTMIVDYTLFMENLSRLLNRPIQSFEVGQNYWATLQEANECYKIWQAEQLGKHDPQATELTMSK